MALAGDPVALRLCLERIVGPRRGRPVQLVGELASPPFASAADLGPSMSSVATAATQRAITPDEAAALSQMVESFARTLVAVHDERVRSWRLDMWQRSAKKTADG